MPASQAPPDGRGTRSCNGRRTFSVKYSLTYNRATEPGQLGYLSSAHEKSPIDLGLLFQHNEWRIAGSNR